MRVDAETAHTGGSRLDVLLDRFFSSERVYHLATLNAASSLSTRVKATLWKCTMS